MRKRRKTLGGVLSALLLALIVLAASGGSGLAAKSAGSGTPALAGTQASASSQAGGVTVGHSVKNDRSPALRSIKIGRAHV